jgi:hypothetical protein
MEPTAEGEKSALRLYLLGQLTPEQRVPLEERLLTDGAFYEELSITEDELIDRYLVADLTAAEREGFETHFLLAPERQRKLSFARSFRRYIAAESAESAEPHEDPVESAAPSPAADPSPAPGKQNLFRLLLSTRPALAYSLAAVLLLAFAVSWIVISRRPTDRPRHEPRNVYAVTLTPGLTRDSGDLKKITIPPDADTLRLRLELPAGDYESYRATLLTAERAQVWTADGLRPGADVEVVDFDVPSTVLKPGYYLVTISGRLPDGSYEELPRFTFRLAD